MELESFIESFKAENCIECGLCIKDCLFRKESEEKPAAIFKKIKDTDSINDISNCLSCMRCNQICPNNASPASLFMYRLHTSGKKGNPPNPAVLYTINGHCGVNSNTNLFLDAYRGMKKRDREILQKWSQPKTGEDILFCGCASRLTPELIEDSVALKGLPKFGGEKDCCGIFALKAGLFDESREIAKNLIKRLQTCSFKRLVFVCASCLEMFRKTMPEILGIDVPFETISIYEYLYEKINEGTLSINKNDFQEATISDSCSGCELGEEFRITIRDLMEMCGIKLSELENNGINTTCCGLPAFLNKGSLTDTLKARKIRIKEIKKNKSKNIITYCQGCSINFDLPFSGFKTHYFLQILLESLGDDTKGRSRVFKKFINPFSIKSFIRISPWILKR